MALKRRKVNWICHILRGNCFLKNVIEGKIEGRKEVTRRKRRRHKQLLDDLKQKRGYCRLIEEAVDRTLWKTCFGRNCGPIARQTKERMNYLQRFLDFERYEMNYRFLLDLNGWCVSGRGLVHGCLLIFAWDAEECHKNSFIGI